MNPFELFQSSGIYKLAVLYFSQSRGMAIVGRTVAGDSVEVIRFSGEVDPHTGNFVALDYSGSQALGRLPVLSKGDFERLVTYIESRIDCQTRMSVIEPELIRDRSSQGSVVETAHVLH